MHHELFEQLAHAGYLHHGKPVESALRRASLSSISDFAQQSEELTSAKDLTPDTTVFSQSASLSLGCSRWPCAQLPCRLRRAEQLAHYAALYGDRIYIRNFLTDYIQHPNDEKPPNKELIRRDFAEDVHLLAYLKPVIEAGRIVPVTPPNYCLHCLSKHGLNPNDSRSLRKAIQALMREIVQHIDITMLRERNGPYGIEVTGPEYLLHDGFHYWVRQTPPPGLQDMPRIFGRIQKGHRVHIARSSPIHTLYAQELAHWHYASIYFELAMAQCLRTSFLTEMPVHIDFLKNLSLDLPHAERDIAIEKHLTCLVPFAKELKPSEILKMRKQDEEAFVVFRAALANAVMEYRQSYGTFTEAEAKALYRDVISPKLANLEATMLKSRRMLIKGTTRKMLAWTAAISAGLYFGLLPQDLLAAATALGLTKIIAEITDTLMNTSDTTEAVRTHDMYFLWKLKNTT